MSSSSHYQARDLASCARRLNARYRGWPALVLVTDDKRLSDPSRAIAELPRNSAVLFRHYDDPARVTNITNWAKAARTLGHQIWIAKDAGLAHRLSADLVHLPEALGYQAPKIRRLYPRLRISVAAHSAQALTTDADAVLISPVFETLSHPGAAALGVTRACHLARLSKHLGLVPYALGGIDDRTGHRLLNSDFAGFAAISGLSPAHRSNTHSW